MKNIDFLYRASSLLILIAIAALFGTALYILRNAEEAHSVVDRAHQQSDTYRSIVTWLEYESESLAFYSSTHGLQGMDGFVASEEQVDLRLREAQKRPADPSDAAALLAVRRMHNAYTASAVDFLLAAAHGKVAQAETIKSQRLVPQFRELNVFLLQRDASAEAAQARLDDTLAVLHPRLRVTILIAGSTTLIIAMALLFTTSVYRRRTERALQQEVNRLEEASLTDSLTGLGNHRAFRYAIAKHVARSQRYLRPFTLAVVDIDHFKTLNDTKGHTYGDDVLSRIGELLNRLRAGDPAYRLGGDEFAILLAEADAGQALIALKRLQRFVNTTFAGVTLSIGFAECNGNVNEHDLVEWADAALYEAKRRGRNTIVDFDAIRNDVNVISSTKTLALQRLLSDDDALQVAFQPIWSINGMILGFEALARPAPDLGFASPQEAFDIAERLHHIIELDLRCIRKTLQMAKALPAQASLFINMVPETLVHPSFDPAAFIAEARTAGIAPSQIVVEITERSIVYPGALVSRAMMLKSLGARIALDDTGAGYAGLEVLSSIAFDFVKIDRGLMLKAQHERGARGVLAGIVSIGQEIGALLIAEGIENFEQLNFIKHVHGRESSGTGVDAVQGYLFGEPRKGPLNPAMFQQYAHRVRPLQQLAS